MQVEYISCNSGGEYWLTDADWVALGRRVDGGLASRAVPWALATRAVREGLDLHSAKAEWSKITGKTPARSGARAAAPSSV